MYAAVVLFVVTVSANVLLMLWFVIDPVLISPFITNAKKNVWRVVTVPKDILWT